MGFIESDVTYDQGEIIVNRESTYKSLGESRVIEENSDLLVATKEPPTVADMRSALEFIKNGQVVMAPNYDGGKILFEKIGYKDYQITQFNSLDIQIGRKIIKYHQLVKIFEKQLFGS